MKLFKRSERNIPERRRPEERSRLGVDDAKAFRRGRTLTGSVSSLVRSTNEVQADLKSPRVHTHELLKKRRRIMGIFVAVICLAAVLYMLVSHFTAHAVVQASPDPSLQLESVYTEAIDDYLADHTIERWRPFTNAGRLTEYLQTVTPEVESVRLHGSAGFGLSLFELEFRSPIASWSVGGKELYVDASGVPFSRNYFDSPPLRISDQSGLTPASTGESVMSNRFMSFIGQVIGLTKSQGYTVETIVIPEGMTRQIEVHLEGVAYWFKFSSDRPAGEGVEDMIRAIEWMKAHRTTPEYIDVRVGGKVFYK